VTSTRHRAPRVAVSAILLAVAFSLAGCTAAAQRQTPEHSSGVVVTSSIENGAVLTKRMQWTATVNPGYENFVTSVVFTIDGKDRWVEHEPPYTFNNDQHSFYPWILSAGNHVFKVVASTHDGTTGSSSIRVTTKGTTIPSALLGTWTRNATRADFGPAFVPDGTPFGNWTIRVSSNGVIVAAVPGGSEGVTEAFKAAAHNLWLEGPISYGVPSSFAIGGFCDPKLEPVSEYSWSRTGDKLTLASATDLAACVDRGGLFEGTWSRVSGENH
jgi:Flp pilus assembly protein TadG